MVPGDLAHDGFARLGPVLAADEVQALRDAAAPLLAVAAGPYGVLRHDTWRELPAFARLLTDGRLAARAREALGLEEVVLFQDHIVWKPPRTDREVSWHQDHAYWPLSAPRGLTMWVALDDATLENGCLWYAPGTHLEGERCPTDFTPGTNQPLRPDLPPIDAARAEASAVAAPLAAGEALVHDPLVWHRSGGNATDGHRRGWSISWVAPDVRWDPAHAPHPYAWSLAPRAGEELSPARFPRFRTLGPGSPACHASGA